MSINDRVYEQLIQDGIIAVKNGSLAQAKRLLEQAALVNSSDVRIWIWLSATTADLQERRGYLEKAVVIDPSNALAKRGLLLLNEKLDKSRMMPEGESYAPPAATAPVEATSKTFTCPNCGAAIAFDIHDTSIVCQSCGYTRKVDEATARAATDRPLDTILPTTRAHHWAQSQARLACEQCGVVILLPPGQTSDICPYCGSGRFISSPDLLELDDPGVIGIFKVDPQKASNSIKQWLGKGLLVPDDLAANRAGIQLHPAYYPFWIFSGMLEIPWFCDVNVGSLKTPAWEPHGGSKFEMFDNVIIPGLRRMTLRELADIEPFNLDELVEFSPEYLAGWVALTYDHPLADASLRARERVIQKVRASLSGQIEPNRPKRRFSVGAGKWSDITYKLALLPIYTGNYLFQGKRYRLLVNGQTGKVSGKKPTDSLKLVLYVVGGLVVLTVLILVLLFLRRLFTG